MSRSVNPSRNYPDPRAWNRYVTALVAVDAVMLAIAFVLAGLLRSALAVLPNDVDFDPARYGPIAAALIPLLLAIFWLRRAYARRNLLGGAEEYARVVSGCTYGTLLLMTISFVYGSLPIVSRGWLVGFWLSAVMLVCGARFCLRRVAYALRSRGHFVRRALVLGAGEQGSAIAEQLDGATVQGVEVLGFLDDFKPIGSPVGPPSRAGQRLRPRFTIVGHPSEVLALATELRVDLLIVVPTALTWESQQLVTRLAASASSGLEIRLAPTQYDLSAAQVTPAPLGFIPLFRLEAVRLVGLDAVLRGSVDAVIAVLLLLLLAPAGLACLLVARLRGVRPLFVQQRVLGWRGEVITLHLLDPRVSGRLLLRGLPTLLEVVRGRLALVGPRPVPIEQQSQLQHWAGLLLAVKPGLTGPWRVMDPAASTAERLLADVWWVRNWSIWQHFFVLFKSARGVWAGPAAGQRLGRWQLGAQAPRGPRQQPYLGS